jgi:hypothetical protein
MAVHASSPHGIDEVSVGGGIPRPDRLPASIVRIVSSRRFHGGNPEFVNHSASIGETSFARTLILANEFHRQDVGARQRIDQEHFHRPLPNATQGCQALDQRGIWQAERSCPPKGNVALMPQLLTLALSAGIEKNKGLHVRLTWHRGR